MFASITKRIAFVIIVTITVMQSDHHHRHHHHHHCHHHHHHFIIASTVGRSVGGLALRRFSPKWYRRASTVSVYHPLISPVHA